MHFVSIKIADNCMTYLRDSDEVNIRPNTNKNTVNFFPGSGRGRGGCS